jgi:hypothetical protein
VISEGRAQAPCRQSLGERPISQSVVGCRDRPTDSAARRLFAVRLGPGDPIPDRQSESSGLGDELASQRQTTTRPSLTVQNPTAIIEQDLGRVLSRIEHRISNLIPALVLPLLLGVAHSYRPHECWAESRREDLHLAVSIRRQRQVVTTVFTTLFGRLPAGPVAALGGAHRSGFKLAPVGASQANAGGRPMYVKIRPGLDGGQEEAYPGN